MKNCVFISYFLTCLVSVYFSFVNSQSTCCPTGSCCDDSCDVPLGLNITLNEVVSQQPYYVTFYPAIPIFAGIDNACYTFFSLPDGSYIVVLSTVYTNRHNIIDAYTLTYTMPGVAVFGSYNCVQENTAFAIVDNGDPYCNVLVSYLCFEFGDCPQAVGNTLPVYGLSTLFRAIDGVCLASAMNAISRAGYSDQDYFILPMKRDPQCVTEIPCTIPS